jgi:UDP-glucose 4-epimerase
MKNKILVTGGAGFIGSNLIRQLIQAGEEVDCLDNFSTGNNSEANCRYYNYDISEISLLNADDYKICFHLAGLSRIQPSFKIPETFFKTNTFGTIAVMEWAKGYNMKIVYSGSSSKHHNPHISPYACSKYLGEEVCKTYRTTFGVDVDIARFYNVYGPNEIQTPEWGAVIGIWRNRIANKLPLQIVGDGEQRRDFTHVHDIVSGLNAISKHIYFNNDAWELGSGVNYSINEVFELFKQRYPDITAEYIPQQKGNYQETLRTNDEALNILNWKCTGDLKEYIKSL